MIKICHRQSKTSIMYIQHTPTKHVRNILHLHTPKWNKQSCPSTMDSLAEFSDSLKCQLQVSVHEDRLLCVCVSQSLDVSYPFTEIFSCFSLKPPCTCLALKQGNLKEVLDGWMGLPITSNQNRMDLFAQGHTGGTLLNMWELVLLVELLQV